MNMQPSYSKTMDTIIRMKAAKRQYEDLSEDTDSTQLTTSGIEMDSDLEDDKERSGGAGDNRKFSRQNHSEIEKRRRDKMNSNIIELSTLIPMCSAMNRKVDKLTVLRMAVEFMKIIQGSAEVSTEVSSKPTFLTDEEVKHMILNSADGFLFVVGCDRGKILYTSESVKTVLNYSQSELIGQSLFDFLHPKDIGKVKEQLLSSDVSPREKLIDSRTLLPVKAEMPQKQSRLCTGARRTFFCRIKTGNKNTTPGLKTEKDGDMCSYGKKKKNDLKNYSIIHCTGYLKSWPPAKVGVEEENDGDADSCNLSCLVAVGKLQQPFKPQREQDAQKIPIRPRQFVARYAIDGKFTYVDHRATEILGYLPQELLGTSVYEYYHQDDLSALAETHRKVLTTNEKLETPVYRFKSRDTTYIPLKTKAFTFHNPWTKEIESIVTTSTVVPVPNEMSNSCSNKQVSGNLSSSTLVTKDVTKSLTNDSDNSAGSSSQRTPLFLVPGFPGGFKIGAGKIGRQIAEEVMECHGNKDDSMSLQAQLWKTYIKEKTAVLKPSGSASDTCSLNSKSKSVTKKTSTNITTEQSPSKESRKSSASKQSSPDPTSASTSRPFSASLAPQNGPSNLPGSETRNTNSVHNQSGSDAEGGYDILEVASSENGSTGSDEAAMAIIMSLLEADAGLGGPIDFSNLPWPL